MTGPFKCPECVEGRYPGTAITCRDCGGTDWLRCEECRLFRAHVETEDKRRICTACARYEGIKVPA